jgi:Ca2+-binding RTX toxin-like protein
MSSHSPTRRWRNPLRHPLTILASAAALSIVGLLAVTGPAYADTHQTITDSADPVPVNTNYDYNVTIIDPNFEGGFAEATIDLSFSGGAAATFTGAITTDSDAISCTASGTHAQCDQFENTGTDPIHITATVLPTAAGIVTADTARTGMGPIASDSTTTTITEPTEPTPPGCTITGTPGNDTLNGTNGADVICGLGGNDTLNGGNGNDTLYGGTGNDTIDGGNSDDTLYGGDGDDIMGGGNGADYLYGQAGNDTNYGETLLGSLLYLFDNGNDHIDGGPGNDDLDGQNGNDTLTDTNGTDTMSGNLGNDTINVQDGTGGDTANGGLGSDTCTADAGDTTTSC